MKLTVSGNANHLITTPPSQAASCTFVSESTSTDKPEKNAARTVSAHVKNTGVEEATQNAAASNQDNYFVDVDRSANVSLHSEVNDAGLTFNETGLCDSKKKKKKKKHPKTEQ